MFGFQKNGFLLNQNVFKQWWEAVLAAFCLDMATPVGGTHGYKKAAQRWAKSSPLGRTPFTKRESDYEKPYTCQTNTHTYIYGHKPIW